MRLFISYSSKDHDYADAVYELLQTIGQDVFWAAETLRPGEQFESLLAQIRQCDMLLLIWSKNAAGSHWVNQEVGAALGTLKYVAAIALDETPLPGFMAHRTAILAHQEGLKALPKLQRAVIECQRCLAEYREAQRELKANAEAWDGVKTLLAIAGVVGLAAAILAEKK
jgi:hypothetical protein